MSTEIQNPHVPIPRGSHKVTEIVLGKTSIKAQTDATPSLLKQTKDLVQLKFDEIRDNMPQTSVSDEQITVLVAFNLAEELLKEQERVRSLKRKVLDKTESLLSRVEAHLK